MIISSNLFCHKVSWYYMDVLLLLLFILMWGLTYPTPDTGINSKELSMQLYFPFIVNAPLCALCLVRHLYCLAVLAVS
jgi:hypothetical protein